MKKRKKCSKFKFFFGYMILIPMICLLVACGQGGVSDTSASLAALVEPVAPGPLPAIPDPPPGSPALAFSDLVNGPKTGWEGSATKGAAVSIWGTGFGSTRGTNYVTVNGAMLVNDTDYAEWGATDNNARGLQRITFWLNNTCADGAGKIAVTINGKTSNPLSFQITSGNIYFISTTGSDSNNGKSSTSGLFSGPWQHFNMASPAKHNLKGGDVVYVRGGNYDTLDEQGWMLYIRGPYNGNGPYFNIAGYPGEWPILAQNITNVKGVAASWAGTNPNNWVGFITLSKFISYADIGGIDMTGGHHWRIIGNTFRNCTQNLWSGIIAGGPGHDAFIYGNIIRDSGYDAFKHVVYFSGYWANQLQSSVYNIDVGWNEVFNFLTYPGKRTGSGMFNFRNAVDPWECYNVWIHDNLVHDSPAAGFLYLEQKTHDIYVYNNIGYNLMKQGSNTAVALLFVGSASPGNNYVYNNTFYDVGSLNGSDLTPPYTYFIFISPQSVAGSNTYSKNNIYYSINGEPIYVSSNSSPGRFYSDHDIFYGNSLTSYSSLVVTHAITADPQFVSLSSTPPDFHLQSTSPAINAGTSDVGSVLNYDYDMISRPQNSAYDIGAYEYH